ncbi:DUF1648 domain-containing protein [Microbacterium sp. NPDC089695]|uniref:DUF1648 domain-containing protein n=1 Tax=Microbacterium sp. NPDC089695 TaxID=3364198 RepID=UPI00380A9E4F
MTDTNRTTRPRLRRARLMFVVVALVVPLVVTGIAAIVLAGWLPSVPEPVITHWGIDGADGFGPASTYLWLLLGVGLGLPVLMAITTLVAVGAHWGGAARLMGALAAGMSLFAATTSLGSLAIQRDPTAEAPGVGAVLAAAFAVLLGGGALAWFVQPRIRPEQGRTLAPRRAVEVGHGERVVWLATVTMPFGALAFLLLVLTGLAALAVYMLIAGVTGAGIVALVVLIVGAAIAATTSYRVSVTPEGFSARALLGRPRVEIPVSEVTAVRAVDVSPFGEFGGWGWRISVDGRTGIVMRRGPAVEVSRRDRRPFLVTIDGAEEAAALLQAYLDERPR